MLLSRLSILDLLNKLQTSETKRVLLALLPTLLRRYYKEEGTPLPVTYGAVV